MDKHECEIKEEACKQLLKNADLQLGIDSAYAKKYLNSWL